MLSKTAEYALRAIVFLAMRQESGKKTGIKELALQLELPSPFLGKIMQDLVRKGVIASLKGPTGGFYLHRPAADITILEVVRTVDGLEAFKKCGMGMKQCSDSHPCPLHDAIKAHRNHLLQLFGSKTMQHLVADVASGHYFITNLPAE